jgi:diacylglycerol kinase (ATP)
MTVGKQLAVIINPRSGRHRGEPIFRALAPRLARSGWELQPILAHQTAELDATLAALDLHKLAGLAIVGGDGTIHAVANALLRHHRQIPVPLGFIPAGTGNVLSGEFGCHTPDMAADRIAAGRTVPLDVARILLPDRELYSLNIIGWGAVADINATAERLRWLGNWRYSVAAIAHMLAPRRRLVCLESPDRRQQPPCLFIMACNTRHTGYRMQMAPRAVPDDGLLDVVSVRDCSRLQMLQIFRRVFHGTHLELPCVHYEQMRALRVDCAIAGTLCVDGEVLPAAPFTVDLRPGVLRVFH